MVERHPLLYRSKTNGKTIIARLKPAYKSFLLRLRRDEATKRLFIRLEAVEKTATVICFVGLEDLVAYLETSTLEFTGSVSTMVTMFVRQSVQDYDHWKRVYTEFASLRQKLGVTSASIFREVHDLNKVTVMLQFSELIAAQNYANSDELREAMVKAGVAGKPEIWFAHTIERTGF